GPLTFIPASLLGAGTHTITAAYSGDANYGASTKSLTQTVNKANSSTTLAVTPPTTLFGQSVTLSAHVSTTSSGAGTPVGSVTFKDGATTLATVAVNGSGDATLVKSNFSVGTHSLTAVFNAAGTGNFATSTSTTVTETVSKNTSSMSLVSS